MNEWLPVLTAWGAALLASGFALYQWMRSTKWEADKELNSQRLNFYPEVQQFMSGLYNRSGGGWEEAIKEPGRLAKMMELSNKLILWASDDTLKVWCRIVNEGQRGEITTISHLALLWAELDINMRKDLGYGNKIRPAQLLPLLFSPKTVDKIKSQL